MPHQLNVQLRESVLVAAARFVPGPSGIDWSAFNGLCHRFNALPALMKAFIGEGRDASVEITNVIIDGVGSAADFLYLLSSLPSEYRGDILLIQADDYSYLSSVRRDDRALYRLTKADVQFYLDVKLAIDHSEAALEHVA